MCSPLTLTDARYSPATLGTNVTVHVPSWLSWQLISAFDGPSTAKLRPPTPHHHHDVITQYMYGSSVMDHCLPAPAFFVSMVKEHGSPAIP